LAVCCRETWKLHFQVSSCYRHIYVGILACDSVLHICIPGYIYVCVYIYIYICVCVCIYMYMYIYICIHTCIYHIHLIIGFWSFHLEPFSCISRAASLGSPREKSIFRVHRYILTVSVSSVTVRKRLSSSSFPRDQIRICNSLKPFPLLQRNRYRKATTNLSSHRFAEY